jgi:hypothetical protein
MVEEMALVLVAEKVHMMAQDLEQELAKALDSMKGVD